MAHRWTPELQEKVTQYVRAGGFVWVSAEAAGLPRAVLEDWMRRGAQSGRQPYRGFRDAIRQARAQARLKAEMETRTRAPRDWLLLGPGRERPGRPGWSHPAKADASTAGGDPSFDLLQAGQITAHVLKLLDLPSDLRIRFADGLARFAFKPREVEDDR